MGICPMRRVGELYYFLSELPSWNLYPSAFCFQGKADKKVIQQSINQEEKRLCLRLPVRCPMKKGFPHSFQAIPRLLLFSRLCGDVATRRAACHGCLWAGSVIGCDEPGAVRPQLVERSYRRRTG